MQLFTLDAQLLQALLAADSLPWLQPSLFTEQSQYETVKKTALAQLRPWLNDKPSTCTTIYILTIFDATDLLPKDTKTNSVNPYFIAQYGDGTVVPVGNSNTKGSQGNIKVVPDPNTARLHAETLRGGPVRSNTKSPHWGCSMSLYVDMFVLCRPMLT
jgi:hypothetical protein